MQTKTSPLQRNMRNVMHCNSIAWDLQTKDDALAF